MKYPDACAKRFAIGNLVFHSPVKQLDLFSGPTYISYFYFDIFGLISGTFDGTTLWNEEDPPIATIRNVNGNISVVESGVESRISLNVQPVVPAHIDLGYFQMFVKDFTDEGDVFEIINLEMKGLKVGGGASTEISVSLGATTDSQRFSVKAVSLTHHRWPPIFDAFLIPGTFLPTSFAAVGFSIGKSASSRINLFSDIPIPAIAFQYLIPRQDGALPFSSGPLRYRLRPLGVHVPLISRFPLSLHCGTVFGSLFDYSVKSPKQASATIYNDGDNTSVDAYARQVSDLFAALSNLDVLHLGVKLYLYSTGRETLQNLVEHLELGEFNIGGAAWITESLRGWTVPLKKFFQDTVDDEWDVVALNNFVQIYLEQTRSRLPMDIQEQLRREMLK